MHKVIAVLHIVLGGGGGGGRRGNKQNIAEI